MRILVTGGAGFIGSHLATHLCEAGHDVRVLDNFATGRRSNLSRVQGEIELVEGDIQSYERANKAVAGCEVVLHQAALPSVPRSVQDPLTSNATNVIGTLNILLAARDHGARRVVCASSSSVYGSAAGNAAKSEDQPTVPISPYATAKLAGEGYARSFHGVYGLETVALRYFNVFGSRQDPQSQYAAVVPNFITALLNEQPPVIFGDGEQSRDFTYVANVVQANLLAIDAPDVAGKVFNVACGERVTLNRLVAELRDLLGSDIEPVYEVPRAGDIKHSLADLSLAQKGLGYVPEVQLREGLNRTIEHYRELMDSDGLVGARER
jgi:UDP-N-acetylglucosamine/UDP-N-acetyl-alpha-D-glucosaminouronate 4-epimerase